VINVISKGKPGRERMGHRKLKERGASAKSVFRIRWAAREFMPFEMEAAVGDDRSAETDAVVG
jgi:hypothetical protein